jgi:hypothetical protein
MPNKSTPNRRYLIVANLGLVVTALWLLAYFMPAGRDMMLDSSLSFLLGLMVTALLGWAAYRGLVPRRLWGLLAAAWGVGLLGNIAWGLYEMMTGQPLPPISVVELFYLARYVLVLLAFWPGLRQPEARQWRRFLAALFMAAVVVVGGFLLYAPEPRWTAVWLSGAIYPILDAGLIYVALSSWRRRPQGQLRDALALLLLALISYSVANWFNFYGRTLELDPVAGLAAFFWPLSDILTGAAVLHLLLKGAADG